jgi:predicted site-specific integrase-resolvase
MKARYANATTIINTLPLSRATFYRWLKMGKIKPKMTGMVKSYDIEKIKSLINKK